MSDKRTCLYDRHVALGAKMVSFGGFEMPLQYTDIAEEHQAVRTACSVFDVSHMGEIFVSGKDAERFVQLVFTNDISQAPTGKIFYGMMLHPTGGTVDDLLVYKQGENDFLLVVNAANIEKDYAWLLQAQQEHPELQVTIDNASDRWGQLAVQGPQAEEIVEKVLGIACSALEFYTFERTTLDNEDLIVSRTGYTGEDGFEIYGSAAYIVKAWDALLQSGQVKPCGLGCRDTLRFEVGLPLYGNELNDEITPLMAGLGMFVKLDKEDFYGKEALVAQKQNGVERKVVGIELEGRAIPRHGYEVVANGEVVGTVTTGYHAISVDKSVCMALVNIAYAKLDTPLEIRIHRKLHAGKVVKKRFYDKHYKTSSK